MTATVPLLLEVVKQNHSSLPSAVTALGSTLVREVVEVLASKPKTVMASVHSATLEPVVEAASVVVPPSY